MSRQQDARVVLSREIGTPSSHSRKNYSREYAMEGTSGLSPRNADISGLRVNSANQDPRQACHGNSGISRNPENHDLKSQSVSNQNSSKNLVNRPIPS
jgi:hypothetical protein